MQLIETLTTQQKIDMLNGEIVGIFNTAIIEDDLYHPLAKYICLGYYTERSATKKVAKIYERVKEICDSGEVTESIDDILGKLIRNKFKDKWTKIYTALISEYNVLDEISHIEIKNGTNTDEIEFDSSITDNGTIGTDEEIIRSVTDNDGVYGFNSANSVGSRNSTESYRETVKANPETNTSTNRRTKDGTDTNTITINETKNLNGRDRSGASLLIDEIDFRKREIFFDIVYKDIDSILTLQIYV